MTNTRELLATLERANAHRDPERLKLKYARMAADPCTFFRGSASLFYQLLPRNAALQAAPLAWITGDLHLENFGSYLGNNALAYFDINDFDEAGLAPVTLECVRVLTHLALSAPTLGIRRANLRTACNLALNDFCHALAAGKAHWLERRLADGAIRRLLRNAAKRRQRDLLAERTHIVRRQLRINVDGRRAMPLPAGARQAALDVCAAAVESLGDARGDRRQFETLDVARRVAGVGSLGLERYVLLVRGDGSPDGARLLDVKVGHRSCLPVTRAARQVKWMSEAQRIVTLQRRLQADSPALLSAYEHGKQSYVLKELQPTQDRLSLADLGRSAARRRSTIRALMSLSAWSMLRASGWDGAAAGEQLVSYAQRSDWHAALLDQSLDMAETFRRCWRDFRQAAPTLMR